MRLLFTLLAGALMAFAQTAPPPAAPPNAPALPPAAALAKPPEIFQSAMEKQRAAMQLQRDSVRRQHELAREWRQWTPLAEDEAHDCEPLQEIELTPLIDHAAQAHQVDSKLVRGVMRQESAFRPCAVSPKGARGLMQLMPATMEQFKVEDPFDPKENVEAAAAFLKQLIDKYKGDLKMALAAYNAGPAAVDKAGGIPDIKETQDYVESILDSLK